MKPYVIALSLAVFPAAIYAQPADPCAGLAAAALSNCRGDQQKLQQQQLLQQQEQLRQQQERQNELAEQQRQMQQQLEKMRVENEFLQKQLERDKSAIQAVQAAAPAQASAANYVKGPEVKDWKAANPWFGTDYPKTSFAMRYAKQLQKDRPDLVGRPFLDAVSEKVRDTFDARK
jgi:TolA-binding protein